MIEASLPAERFRGHGFGAKFGETKFFKRNGGEVESLGATVVDFAIHAVLVVATGAVRDAALGFAKERGAGAEDDRASGTDGGAAGFQAVLQASATEFALGDARVITLPLESGNVIRTGDGAISAADAFVGCPADDAGFGIFVKRLEGATGGARGIETMHALAFHE